MDKRKWHKWFAWYPVRHSGEFYFFCFVWRRIYGSMFGDEWYIYKPSDGRDPSKKAIDNHNDFNSWLTRGGTETGFWNVEPLTYKDNPED